MLAAFLGIALYTALAGASAGVVRAAIMGGLGVFAAQIGRRQYELNSLAFVAALIKDHCLGPVTALLADGGYAPLNPPEWIERWRPQVVLLSVAAGDVNPVDSGPFILYNEFAGRLYT